MLRSTCDVVDWLRQAYRRKPIELMVAVLSTMVFAPLAIISFRFMLAIWAYVPGPDSLLFVSALAGICGLCIHMVVSVWRGLAENVSRATQSRDHGHD
jgi:hypothetical protein